MNTRLVAALVGLAVAAIYSNAVGHYLVWTDVFQIGQQRMVVRDLANVSMVWSPPQLYGENYWRPLQVLANSADWLFWGDSWTGYHATNVALHALCAMLVFGLSAFVLERVRGKSSIALAVAVALLWAISPLKSESVAWIADRCSLLAASLVLCSVLLSLHQLAREEDESGRAFAARFFVWPAVFYLLALLSKESAIGAPLLLAATHWVCGLTTDRRKWWPVYAPLALVSVGYALVRFTLLWHPHAFEVPVALQTRIATQAVLTVDYLWSVFWPFRPLASDAFALHGGVDATVAASALLLLGLLAGAVALARRGYPLPLFGFIWFVVCLGPAANIFPQRHLRGDRYLYFASYGLVLATVWAVTLVRLPRIAMFSAFSLVLVTLSWATVQRNAEWAVGGGDDSAFFRLELQRSPQFREALGHLCQLHTERGEYAEALALCERGLALDSRKYAATAWQPQSFRAQVLDIHLRSGDCLRGMPAAREALVLYPQNQAFRSRLAALRERCPTQ